MNMLTQHYKTLKYLDHGVNPTVSTVVLQNVVRLAH